MKFYAVIILAMSCNCQITTDGVPKWLQNALLPRSVPMAENRILSKSMPIYDYYYRRNPEHYNIQFKEIKSNNLRPRFLDENNNENYNMDQNDQGEEAPLKHPKPQESLPRKSFPNRVAEAVPKMIGQLLPKFKPSGINYVDVPISPRYLDFGDYIYKKRQQNYNIL